MLMVSPFRRKSTNIYPSTSQKTVPITLLAKGLILAFFGDV
jgi:hypothetical protein